MKRRILALAMTLVMVLNCFGGGMVFAEDGDTIDHTGWQEITQSTIGSYGFTTGGCWYFDSSENDKYYLGTDIALDITVYVYSGDEITLDLNGYNLSMNSGNNRTVLNLKSNSTLNLYGSGSTITYWKLEGDNVATESTIADYDFVTTGGAITGGTANAVGGGGVFIQGGATLNMYGGNIVGNQCAATDDRQGGGIYNYEGTINLYGGTIQGNASNKTIAGGVYNRANSTFNMYGGLIANNYSVTYGAGLYNAGVFNMSGGSMEENTAQLGGGALSTIGAVTLSEEALIQNNLGIYRCGGAFIADGGSVTMTGGTITGNHAGNGGEGGVGVMYDNSAFYMSGGTITGNTSTGVSAGVGYSAGIFTLSGDATITDNYVVTVTDGVKTEIKSANLYLFNGMAPTVSSFTGMVGVTTATSTGTVSYGNAYTVSDSGDVTEENVNLVSDNTTYYPVKVGSTVELQPAQVFTGEDATLTYSGDIDLSAYFGYENDATVYSITGGSGTATISGSTLDPTVAGSFALQAVTPYSQTNAPNTETLTLTVEAKEVTVTGIETVGTVVNDKVELDNTSGTINSPVSGDDVSIDFAVAYGKIDGTYQEGVATTYDVILHDVALSGEDAGVYSLNTVSGTTVSVDITTPYIAWPTAKDITYGDGRSNEDLIGGQVMIQYKTGTGAVEWFDVTDSGDFVWVTDETESAGTHTYTVQFKFKDTVATPDTDSSYDKEAYYKYVESVEAVTHNITQVVNMAEVEFVITGNVTTDSDTLSIIAYAGNQEVEDTAYQLYYTDVEGSWVLGENGLFAQNQSAPTGVGAYLIAADFTANSTITNPNYVHAGTMESYGKQIGALEIYAAGETAPTTYSVEFKVDGVINGSLTITNALPESIHILPTLSTSEYSGWDYDGTIYDFGARLTQIEGNMSLTAIAVTGTGTISGTITGTNLKGEPSEPSDPPVSLEGVVVALMQGAEQIAITTTDKDGKYSFTTVPHGRYNVVVTRDYVIRNEETVYVEVDATTAPVDVTIPDTRQNTIFNVASGMTAITVEGMKDLTFDTTDRSVKVDLTTATVADTQNVLATVASALGLTADNCKLFIDVSIQERNGTSGYVEQETLGTSEYLTFYIPLAGLYQGYDNYIVYQDDGSVAKLSSTVNANSEYATVSASGDLLTLHVQTSAVYGLAFYNDVDEVDGTDATVTYTTEAIDTAAVNTVEETTVNMFANVEGTKTYVIASVIDANGDAGEATIDSEGKVTVTKVGSFEITANDGTNYATATLTVNKKEVTISGITSQDSGMESESTAVTINQGGLISTVETGDDVKINFTNYTATIDTITIDGETGQSFADDPTLLTTGENTFAVTVTGLTLTGDDATNYTLTGTVTSQVALSISIVHIAWPSAFDVVYGTERSDDDLYGGKVMVYEDGTYVDITDNGDFKWVEIVDDRSMGGSEVVVMDDPAGTYQYQVQFVEDGTHDTTDDSYKTTLSNSRQLVTQVVQPAAVTFEITNNIVEYGTDDVLTITPVAENDDDLLEDTDYTLQYSVAESGVWTEALPTAVGDYYIAATFTTTNYRHTGTMESTGKQIGAFSIYQGTQPTTYTVTYMIGDSVYDTVEDVLPQTIHNLPNLDADRAYAGQYTGWLLEGTTTYEFDSRYGQGEADVVFTAVEAPDNITISGTISGVDLNGTDGGLSRVGVALYQGSTLVAFTTTATGEDEAAIGTYSFDVAPELYNLVITRDLGEPCNITVFVDATDGDVTTGLDFILPDVTQNAILTVQSGMPDLVVEGLNSLAISGTDGGTQDSEYKLTIAAPSDVLTDPEVLAVQAKALENGLTNDTLKLYMDIDLTSKLGNEVLHSDVTELDDCLTFYIPLTGIYQGHDEYYVYRYHDGEAQILTTTPVDGEYFVVSEGKDMLELHAKYYSLYAIGYANEEITSTTTSGGSSSYSVTVAPTTNGSVAISAAKFASNSEVSITPTPDEGYAVGTVTVTYASGREVSVTDNGDGTYSYLQPGAAVTVTVTFVALNEGDGTFADVDTDDWFYEAVEWAVEAGVTTGKTDTTFDPYGINTRGEAVTFLWRTMGQPTYTIDNPFEDVVAGTFYYDAVLWAMENGVTIGTTDTTYSPYMDCSRAHIITFLWRMMGKPIVDSDNPFTDVNENNYYYHAVLWAVEEGITTGTTTTTFSPDQDCNRSEIVTFLYRAIVQ